MISDRAPNGVTIKKKTPKPIPTIASTKLPSGTAIRIPIEMLKNKNTVMILSFMFIIIGLTF